MILGTGIDIIEEERVKRAAAKRAFWSACSRKLSGKGLSPAITTPSA